MASIKRALMRCVSYCTAGSYDLNALSNSFKRKGFTLKLSRDVLQVSSIDTPVDVYFFNYGAMVCWGLTLREEQKYLAKANEHAINPLPNVESDRFGFRFGEETSIDTHERFRLDLITLESDDPQVKLAISYGVAQSVKLEAFEAAIKETIKKNNHFPFEIASRGSISLSRRALVKRMGEIFIARSSINLNSEYLDVPEFFWRNPHVESYYIMIKKFLDLPSRVSVLNQQLDVLQDLFDILNSQIQHRHSTMLETVIIILITIEIVISLINFG